MRAFFFATLMALMPLAGLAQSAATLIADRLVIDQNRRLIATGNVEAFLGSARLTAREIRFDRGSGRLEIIGPITLQDGEDIQILANAASLDPKLQSGLLSGARLILNQQLRLNADQIKRSQGRLTELEDPSVTSCKICENETPLWQIKAQRVVHDQTLQRLYFYQARLLIKDVPVLYIPRLHLPDPSVERASGFLIPSLVSTSQLGTGVRVPYFWALDAHRDLTITPYLSARTRTVGLRYRQAFVTGDLQVDWALTDDTLRPGATRGFVFAQGQYALPDDFNFGFALEVVSDDAYLQEYGVSAKDRLTNDVSLWRARADQYIGLSALNFKSLREGEENATLPTLVLDGTYEARMPAMLGGTLQTSLSSHSHYRTSTADVLGRDVNRLNAEADWLRQWTLSSGVQLAAQFGTTMDAFRIHQDSGFDSAQAAMAPRAALTLRLPMQRQTKQARQNLEPVAMIGWAGDTGLALPNDESTRVEFDEGNLFALSRFPRPDRREAGAFGAFGLGWSRLPPNGGSQSLTFGQILRAAPDSGFTLSSGLSGGSSDLLMAGQIIAPGGNALALRSLFNERLDFTKAELRGTWQAGGHSLSGSYLWLREDSAELRLRDTSEFNLSSGVKLTRHWQANADWRFDLADDRSATAGLGLTYNNECVTVNFSVDRRYTASTSLEPSTNLGFTVGLRGFSAQKGTERFARTCRK